MATSTFHATIEGIYVDVDVEDHDGPSVFLHVTVSDDAAPLHVIVNGEEIFC